MISAALSARRGSGEPLEQVLKRADEALYTAQISARNRVCAPLPRLVA